MSTITNLSINYADSAFEITLADGGIFALDFMEVAKLNSAMLGVTPPEGLGGNGVLGRGQNTLFTPVIKAALDGKVINHTEALMIADYTNRGFANPNNTAAPNLLVEKFPEYLTFLEHFRTATGDPNAV